MGNVEVRAKLAQEMERRGEHEDAFAVWKYIFETASPDDWMQGQAALELAKQAESKKRWAEAANYLDYVAHSSLSLRPDLHRWLNYGVGSFLELRFRTHVLRAKDALKKEDFATAAAATKTASEHLPAHPSLAEQLIPKLDQNGQSEVADEIFERAFAIASSNCGLFPKNPEAHHDLAYFASLSKRRLDDALKHVDRAIELDPVSGAYHMTRARIQFFKGNREEAFETAKRAIELDPANIAFPNEFSHWASQKD